MPDEIAIWGILSYYFFEKPTCECQEIPASKVGLERFRAFCEPHHVGKVNVSDNIIGCKLI